MKLLSKSNKLRGINGMTTKVTWKAVRFDSAKGGMENVI
jgi:hypothetical protein